MLEGGERGVFEVETKIVLPECKHLRRLREKLASLGCVFEEHVVEEDVYYQHPCRNFAETDEALRIRVVEGKVELTYKGPKKKLESSVKAREEISVSIASQPKQVKAMLEKLGFREVAVIRKERDYYSCGDATVSLDHVEKLGCFVEIEYRGRGDASSRLEELIERLGLEGLERTTLSYLELLLRKFEDKRSKS